MDLTPGPLDARPGQAVYSRRILAVYDLGVLRLSYPLAWGCPSKHLVAHYNRNVGVNHLDIGVGTGFFLDRCRFPQPPTITLVDMNANSLAVTDERLRRYRVSTLQANILDPLLLPPESFDSIGINCLLHCLPGTFDQKTTALANVRKLVRPGGVVFGSTVLVKGVHHNPLGRYLVNSWNRRGIWSNRHDDHPGPQRALGSHFTHVEIEMRGRSALFTARP
ncbi:class I SAM-dependent methyltransferase [Nocardia crassostreae]|uniref:class I SAM-dependent methyltransferase n=1 Tax=Nocardia crassostreae TaxID=53428 RepID=UPI00083501E1|nr:class I SAM-dependent methyltransferase [Nocardia crassostreae]